MRTLVAIILLASLVTFAPPAASDACVPKQYPAQAVGADPATIYKAQYEDPNEGQVMGVFLESNNLPGLQITEGAACGAQPDMLIHSACTTINRQVPGFNLPCLVRIN